MPAINQRFHGLDALRGFAMLLGIVLHSALPYMGFGESMIWPSDNDDSRLIAIIFQFIHLWRMPVFFILSGFFASLLVSRYGWPYWWKNRFLRIVLPIIIFTFIMSATIPWIFKYGYTEKLSLFYSNDNQPHHLWFLWHLIIITLFTILYKFYSLIFLKLLNIVKLSKLIIFFNFIKSLIAKILFDFQIPITLIIILTICSLNDMGTELVGNPVSTGIYFAFGYSLYKNNKLFHNIIHNWKYYFLAAIVFFLIHTLIEEEYISIDFEQFPVFWIPFIFIKISTSVLFSFSFIGLAENKFGSYSSISRFCSDGTYWMYLIHLPIVAFITAFMFQFEFLAEIKFLLAIIMTTLLCLTTYKFLVRSTYLGLLLNGKIYPFKWNNFN